MTADGTSATLKQLRTRRGLARMLGLNYRKMMFVAYVLPIQVRHRVFTIPKRSGGTRTICAPTGALLSLQRRVKELLEKTYRPRNTVHGFVKGLDRGIKSNATAHANKRWVLSLDLEDYFESIHFGRVVGRLRAKPYGLSQEVAEFIAHIACYTRQVTSPAAEESATTSVLMTGGALSPLLANIVSDRLDNELARYCRDNGCTFTRYADDISISCNRNRFPRQVATPLEPDSFHATELSNGIVEIIERNGFRINHSKTRLQSRSQRQEVTGLVVNEKVNVSRRYVRQVRAMLHDWAINGLQKATQRHFDEFRPERGRLPAYEANNFEWVVRGKIEFIRHIKGSADGVFRSLAQKFNDLTTGSNFSIPIVATEDILEAAVWRLENDDDAGFSGSAFAVGDNLFATCAHCLGENLKLFSVKSPNFGLTATPVAVDQQNDIALIELASPMPGLMPDAVLQIHDSINPDTTPVGSVVQTAGFPVNHNSDRISTNMGQVVGVSSELFGEGTAPQNNAIVLSHGTFQGMSGGPVLMDGQVIGVIARGPSEQDKTQTPIAIHVEKLRSLIQVDVR